MENPSTNAVVRAEQHKEEFELFKSCIAPPGTPDAQIKLAIQYARQLGLDPLRRQVMIINARDGAKIVVGINALRAVVQRHVEWVATRAAPVYKDDEFSIDEDGNVRHTRTPHKSEKFQHPVGAWSTTIRMRHGYERKFSVYLPYNDYYKSSSQSWISQGAWMITKTAEAFSIRQAFSDVVGGVYIPEEFGAESDTESQGDEIISYPSGTPTMEEEPAHRPPQEAEDVPLKERLAKMIDEKATVTVDGVPFTCRECGGDVIKGEDKQGMFHVCKKAWDEYAETQDSEIILAHYWKRYPRGEQEVPVRTKKRART